jgi:parallel beta-helix repeat protein
MALPSFTVTGSIDEITGSVVASELGEYPPTTLRFVFTTNLAYPNDVITYNAAMYKVSPIYAGINESGVMKQATMNQNQVVCSSDDVRLVAEDNGLNVSALQWRVALETPVGTRWQELTHWWFPSQVDGATINLATVARVRPLNVVPLVRTGANANDIIDSSSVGRAVLTAADEEAARDAIGVYAGTNVKEFGATGDGTTDDTTAIHAARTAAGVGGTVVIPPGTYITTGLSLNVASQVWQIMPGATIKCKSSGYGAATVTVTASGVTITGGGAIDGNRAALGNNAAGVHACVTGMVSSNDLTLDNVTVKNSTYYGVWGQGSHTRVLRCKFTGNYWTAIMLSSYYLAVQIGSTMQDTYDMEASDNYIDRSDEDPATISSACVQITGNGDPSGTLHETYRAKALRNVILMPENPNEATGRVCGIELSRCYYGLAEGNMVVNGTMGISLAAGAYNKSIGNTMIGQTLFGIEIADCPGCIIQGNIIDGDGLLGSLPSGAGIATTGGSGLSTDLSIVGNRIFSLDPDGRPITLSSITQATLTGNVIEHRYGPVLTSVSNSVVSSNVILGDSVGQGVVLVNCSSITVIGNDMQNHSMGVVIGASSGTSDYFNITGNHFRSCTTPVDGTAAGGTIGTNIINANNLVRA